MKKIFRYLLLLISISSCEEDQTRIMGGFELQEYTVTEDSGLKYLTFDLGSGLTTPTTLTITISGTAGMEGDFVITTLIKALDIGNGVTKVSGLETTATNTTQVQYVVLPGQENLTIPIRILDDIQIEPRYETIHLEITDISASDVEVKNKSATIFIEDTDVPMANKVQVDLSWQLQTGGSINGSNFDLYLVRNAKFSSSGTTYELVSEFSSHQDTGYESLFLNDLLPNEQYYVMISYLSGGSSAKIKLVVSQDSDIRTASGQVGSSQIGTHLFFGPITKSISGFSFREQINELSWND